MAATSEMNQTVNGSESSSVEVGEKSTSKLDSPSKQVSAMIVDGLTNSTTELKPTKNGTSIEHAEGEEENTIDQTTNGTDVTPSATITEPQGSVTELTKSVEESTEAKPPSVTEEPMETNPPSATDEPIENNPPLATEAPVEINPPSEPEEQLKVSESIDAEMKDGEQKPSVSPKRTLRKRKEVTDESVDLEDKTPLLEAPLIVEGKRSRQKVERLDSTVLTPERREKKKPTPKRGRKSKSVAMPPAATPPVATPSASKRAASRSTRSAKKPAIPSDTEIKSTIKNLLKGVNLEEVTMKEMTSKVYETYPEVDLTNKKEFIKDTVKALLSATE